MRSNLRRAFAFAAAAVVGVGILSCGTTKKKSNRSTAGVASAAGKQDVCGFNSNRKATVPIEKKSVEFNVRYQANCGLEKFSRFTWSPVQSELPYGIEITSLDYPDRFVAVNQAVTGWFHQPPTPSDIDYFAKQVVPLLKQAAASPSLEMATLTRDEAKEKWLTYLLKRPLH